MLIKGKLSAEEWRDLAPSIGEVASSIAFIVGDWLVYGQGRFESDGTPASKVDGQTYQLALAATGLDLSTQQNYSYVSRNIPYQMRSERLSWEHHRLLAKLPDDEIVSWIAVCVAEEDAGRRMSTRRLRKSRCLGRVANDADLEPDPADKGRVNYIPFVNRICRRWHRLEAERFT